MTVQAKLTAKGYWLGCLIFTVFIIIVKYTVIVRLGGTKHISQEIIEPCICPYWNGGLGNIMFEYASLFGISNMKEMPLMVNKDDTISTVFPNIPTVSAKYNISKICKKAIVVAERKACAFGMESYSFNRSSVIFHRSYLQSWRYFQLVQQDIRKQFVFPQKVRTEAHNNIKNKIKHYKDISANTTDLQVIGIHVRRGDYLLKAKKEFGYHVATKQYIDSAMDYFRSEYNNTVFLTFTAPINESLIWRKENINASDVIHMEPKSKEVDMCSLTLCNHTIITVGSFGWWSAWLGQGQTIYFKDVARQNSSLRNEFSGDMTDFFYPDWIGF